MGEVAAAVFVIVILVVDVVGVVVDIGSAGVVPGGDFGGGGDARGAGCVFCGRDERGGRAEDGQQGCVDVGFDVDRVGGCAGVDERDEDAQAQAEHGGSGAAELAGRFAGFVKGLLARLREGDHFG